MKESKEYGVILLATNAPALKGDIIILNLFREEMQIFAPEMFLKNIYKHHLHVLSLDKIQIGDYYYNETAKRIYKCNDEQLYDGVNYKIVATTNEEFNLPVLPNTFIDIYALYFNKGNRLRYITAQINGKSITINDGKTIGDEVVPLNMARMVIPVGKSRNKCWLASIFNGI